MNERDTSFRPDIEGLRGIAVLLIVAFHAGVPGFRSGFVGVDVFFVLSGYLITRLIVEEIERSRRFDALAFFARRARRLIPALTLVTLATLALMVPAFSPILRTPFSQAAAFASLYSSNLWFASTASDYFAQRVDTNLFLHTWSLGVEEQFYLVWPVLLWAVARKGRPTLVLALAAVCVASFALSLWLTDRDPASAFFISPARAWEFGVGGLAALVAQRPGARSVVGWLGLALVVTSACGLTAGRHYRGYDALIPATLGTVCLLRYGSRLSILQTPILRRIGRVSYGWYLWHWPLLLIAGAYSPAITWPMKLVVCSIAYALAEGMFVGWENPIRQNASLLRRPGISVALGLSLSGIALAASLVSLQVAELQTTELHPTDFADAWDSRTCPDRNGLKECTFGPEDATRRLVLFGDSHAAHWLPALQTAFPDAHITTLIHGGCSIAKVKNAERGCGAWRRAALSRILELQPSMVFMSNARVSRAQHGPEAQADGLRDALEVLSPVAEQIVYVADTPRPGFDVPQCLWRAEHRDRSSCSIARAVAVDDDLNRRLRETANAFPRASFVDLTDRFCDTDRCAVIIDGHIAYNDREHLTPGFSRALAGRLVERIAR